MRTKPMNAPIPIIIHIMGISNGSSDDIGTTVVVVLTGVLGAVVRLTTRVGSIVSDSDNVCCGMVIWDANGCIVEVPSAPL